MKEVIYESFVRKLNEVQCINFISFCEREICPRQQPLERASKRRSKRRVKTASRDDEAESGLTSKDDARARKQRELRLSSFPYLFFINIILNTKKF